jgi:hypothetical protein
VGASLAGPDKDVATCPPTAWNLTCQLASKANFPAEKGEKLDLAKVAQYMEVVSGRDALQRSLRKIFDHDYTLLPLHQFLADIPTPLLIVTTNYDDLIERAFRDKMNGRPYDLVIHSNDQETGNWLLHWEYGRPEPKKVIPNKLDINVEERTVIYKMHGTVFRPPLHSEQDQYVISEDDYIDFLTRMTKKTAIPAIFAQPFQSRPFLFLGYGLRDWNWRVILNRIEKDWPRRKDIKSWAIQKEVSELERRLWQERGVEVFEMPIDQFLKDLVASEKAQKLGSV